MKVLVVTEPGVDGVFRYVEMLCHFLVGRGVEVHLAYSDRRGSDRLPVLVAWIEAHGGRTVNLQTGNGPAWSDAGAFLSLLRLARAVRPDIIHSHSSKAGALARTLPLLGIRAVQVYHPHAYVGMRPERARLDVLYNAIESRLGRKAHTVVVSTGEYIFASDRLKIPPERVHLIPNGVDTDLFSPVSAEAKRRLRAGMGLPEHEPLLGFIGRSSAQKDPVTLYEAFARAAAIRPMSLLHVGRGELDGELEALVRQRGMGSRVFREPYMSVPVNFYRVVDGFILTSHYEGLSLAAAEALAANLPVILSAAAGNKDFLALPLSHAWQAAPGDIDGFARAIAAWAEKLGTTKPVNHREIAQARFDLREKCGEVLHLYHQLTGETQPVRIQRLPAHSHRRTRTPSRR